METDESGFEPVFPSKPSGQRDRFAAEQVKPVALIHGLFGWGEQTPLWGAAPQYFPLDEIRKARPRGTIVAVQVGAMSSNFDRACEAFAQLYGLRTDYGELHSMQCGHARFGKDYTEAALLDCEWDEQNPIHLIGHSFGGNTALTLVTLLAQDFWGLGTSSRWVASVSTICSPLRGCTLPYAWGFDGFEAKAAASCSTCATNGAVAAAPAAHGTLLVAESANDRGASGSGGGGTNGGGGGGGAASSSSSLCSQPDHKVLWCKRGQVPRLFSVVNGLCILCAPLIKAQFRWPWLTGLFDFRVSQWGDPYVSQMISMRHAFWITGDNMLIDGTPAASSQALRNVRPHLHDTYLVSVTCDQTAPTPMLTDAQVRRAKLVTAATAAVLALLVHRFRTQLRRLLRDASRDARRYLLALMALAALLRHRAARRLKSPRLAAIVAAGSIATVGAATAAVAAAATVLGIPLRRSAWTDGSLQQLAPLRPLIERLRPILHAYLLPWLVRPALRLNSAAIHRTRALLQGDLRVSFAASFVSDTNDGIVDLPSHVGVDSVDGPCTTSPQKKKAAGKGCLRTAASAERLQWKMSAGAGATGRDGKEESDGVSTLLARGLPDRPAGKPVRSFSNHNVATADGATNEEADPHDTLSASPEKLDKGRWHIMRVPGADHSLGTWASDKTDDMFRELLALLDAQT